MSNRPKLDICQNAMLTIFLSLFQPKHPQSLLKQKPVTHTILVTSPNQIVTSASTLTGLSGLAAASNGSKLLFSRLSGAAAVASSTTATTAVATSTGQPTTVAPSVVVKSEPSPPSPSQTSQQSCNSNNLSAISSTSVNNINNNCNRMPIQTSLISSQPVSFKVLNFAEGSVTPLPPLFPDFGSILRSTSLLFV